MEIKRLKMENSAVLFSDSHDGKLTLADQSQIPDIQTLLRRVETHSYINKSKKENLEFNKDLKVGTGSMKSFKDEDGDFICRYESKDNTTPIQIDEDFEFEQVDNMSAPDTSNLWVKREQPMKTDRTESKLASPTYRFQKRSSCTSASRMFRTAVLMHMKRVETFNHISYVKKSAWAPEKRLDGDLVKAIINYNRSHGIESGLDGKFILKIENSYDAADEEFEKLLEVVVGHK